MNTGLQDAANLSWKLVAVLRDGAGERLLETYEGERHPVGEIVLRMSGTLVRVGILHAGPTLLVRAVLGRLLTRVRPITDRAASMISGIGISYGAGRGSHRLTGKRAPDWPLTEGRVYELLREGRFVLVGPGAPPADVPKRVTAATWADGRRTTVLVRPDGYIAWASDAPDAEGLRTALAEWTGATA
jgi:hypothetical protein